MSNIVNQVKGSTGRPPYMDSAPEEYRHPADVALPPSVRRANATFVILARNGDLNGIMMSMKQMGALASVLHS